MVAKDDDVTPDDPCVPPKGGICFINDIPTELLCDIFAWSCTDDRPVEKVDLTDYWDKVCSLYTEQTRGESEGEDEDDGEGVGEGDEKSKSEESDEDENASNGNEGEEDDGDWGETDDEDSSNAAIQSPYTKYRGPPPPSHRPFQTIISHVCHHWRTTALSNPSLWTRFKVGPVAGRSYELESMMLQRSENLPIDVYINAQYCNLSFHLWPPSEADFSPLVSKLVSHIRRWRTMRVNVKEYPLMYGFLDAISDPSIPVAPQLTALDLCYDPMMNFEEFDNFEHPVMSKYFTLFGGSVPQLTTLSLWGVHFNWSQPWIASATNLTDLTLSFLREDVRPSWPRFAAILRGAPALKKLCLSQSGPSGNPHEWFIESTPENTANLNAPIQLLQLTDLTLEYISQARVIGLVRKFHLPSLKKLHLGLDDEDYTDFVHELARPTTSSSSAQPRSLLNMLQSFSTSTLPCNDECVKTPYRELQNATSLKLLNVLKLPQGFLDFLGTPSRSTGRTDVLLPKLASLYVHVATGEALREVVQKRMDAGIPLSALCAGKYSKIFKKEVEWFRENLEFDFREII